MNRVSFFLNCLLKAKSQSVSVPSEDENQLAKKTSQATAFHFRRLTRAGVRTWADGERYEGFLLRNQPYKFGRYCSGKPEYFIYEGEWKNSLPDGTGVKTYSNGKKYEGQFLKGARHGFGRLSGKDLLSGKDFEYEGEWQDNLPHGYRVKTYPNGEKYIGEFVNGDFRGRGMIMFAIEKKFVKVLVG